MNLKNHLRVSKMLVTAVATIFAGLLICTAVADPIGTCVQGVTTIRISRKENLPDAKAPDTDFAPITAQGKSYIPTGGIAVGFQNPGTSLTDIASLLARHIAAMKAQDIGAMKAQFLVSEHAKIDAFLSNSNVQTGFWASAQAIQSCRLLLVREMGDWIDAWVEETFSTGTVSCSRFTVKCEQGRLWMATAPPMSPEAKVEHRKLKGFLLQYGVAGIDVVEQ